MAIMKRRRHNQAKKKKLKQTDQKKTAVFGGFIDGKSFEILPNDPDYEFMSGLWDAIEKDVKDSEKKQAT